MNKNLEIIFKYPSPEAIASPLSVMLEREQSKLFRVFRNITTIFLKLMYHSGCSANELSLKAKDNYRSVLQSGRSMIEMLGVLAIIAVLSVGGIAGYSKAMEKFKLTKAISEYNFMIFGLLDHIDEIKKQTIGSGFVDLAYSLNLVPAGWKKQNDRFLIDDFNNNVQLFNNTLFRYGQINVFAFEIYFGQDGKGFFDSHKHKTLCRELMITVAKPLHEIVYSAYLWRGKTSSANDYLFGTKYCDSSRKCLADVTLTEIENLCRSCTVDNSGDCSLVLYF